MDLNKYINYTDNILSLYEFKNEFKNEIDEDIFNKICIELENDNKEILIDDGFIEWIGYNAIEIKNRKRDMLKLLDTCNIEYTLSIPK